MPMESNQPATPLRPPRNLLIPCNDSVMPPTTRRMAIPRATSFIPVPLPRRGAQHVTTVTVQAANMTRGEGAAVGDHQEVRGRWQVVLQELELLGDGGVAVVVAVEDMAEHGQGSIVIDHGTDPGLDELVIGSAVAIGEVRGWEVGGGCCGRQR